MRRIVTISYTGLNAGGGVPKFNRDLHAAFPDRECIHFCWEDFASCNGDDASLTEWDRARILNHYLIKTKSITSDDVVIADGFWASGLEHRFPLAVSHSHGIWSHLTHTDVALGKEPDMPHHHAAQVSFRKRWTSLGKHITAVSDFIANEMKLQWGFTVDRVINNGVDTNIYKPMEYKSSYLNRKLVIHGVNDRGNINKGWDHIELLNKSLDADVMSLDDAYQRFSFFSDRPWSKSEVLAQADLVVHPSGYEGNSMFIAEALSCGVPVVGYAVGFLWKFLRTQTSRSIGEILSVHEDGSGFREPKRTLRACEEVLKLHESILCKWYGMSINKKLMGDYARELAVKELSITKFNENWHSYIEEITNAT